MRLTRDHIPEPVHELCKRLEREGHRAWVVGGCVRDLLMGRPISDWDLATTALPGDVQRIFRRTIPTGIQHGTVTVLHKGEAYEVTTLRGESGYTDGRRPDEVRFVREIEEDLARRDFTVNAIAYDPITEELVDPWGGLADLEARLIRAVGEPDERFGEDGLRVLRAARFCATLGFRLEPRTAAAIPQSLGTFRKVSAERVHEEWRKALVSPKPSPAFEVMRETGILAVTCEPLASLAPGAFERTLRRVDACRPDFGLRLAALLWELPLDGAASFADAWLRELRCSNEERHRIVHLVEHRDVPEIAAGAAARAWLREVGREAALELLDLRDASGVDTSGVRRLLEAEARSPVAVRELPIGGRDVMQALSLPPSRRVGAILEWLLDRVIEDPALASREALLALLPRAASDVGEGA